MNFLLKNIELKILAFFSALILWFFVVGIENNAFRFPEQLEIHAVNVGEQLSITNDLGKATLRIRAPQDLVKNLTKSDFDLSIDVKNMPEGEYDLPVSATSKNDKATILKVEPATVHVILEAITQKEVKIKAVVSGSPAKGFSVGTVQVTPTTVTVHGGKTLLNKLNSIDAEIKMDGTEMADFTRNILLKLPENLTSDSPNVVAAVSITQNQAQKSVTVSPHLQGNAALLGTSKLVITPQNILLQGDETLLNALKTLDTEPLSYDALKASTIPLKLKIILPEGVTLVPGQPATVMISLTKP